MFYSLRFNIGGLVENRINSLFFHQLLLFQQLFLFYFLNFEIALHMYLFLLLFC